MKISKEAKQKLVLEIKSEILKEVSDQIESKQVRLDQSDIDSIVSRVQSQITIPSIDQEEIVTGLLKQVVTDEEQKRLDFYRYEVFTPKIKAEIGKQVLDQIELPKDGEKGEKGEPGPPGKDAELSLTDKDRKEIANLIDLTSLDKSFNKKLATLVEQLKRGKIKIPNAGIDAREILTEINKIGSLFDFIDLQEDTELTIPENPGVLSWNKEDYTMNINTGIGPILQVGQETHVVVYNGTGETIENGKAVSPIGSFNGRPSIGKMIADSHETLKVTKYVTTMDIPNGSYGIVTQFGFVRGIDTSSLSEGMAIWVSKDTAGELTTTKPEFPNYPVFMGGVVTSDATNGVIFVNVMGEIEDTITNFWNGVFRESFNFLVTSNGTTVTGSLSPANGHPNMTMMFSDGFTTLDTSPAATITLTPGSASSPQQNFIYIPKSTKVLTVSTTDWPTAEHIKIGTVVLRTAALTQTDGALKNHNWNDEIQNTTTNQGHLSHIGERMRQLDAKWDVGVEATVSGTPSNVYVSTTSGVVYQMHKQTFPAQSMPTDDIHVVNNLASNYVTVTDLNTQVLDAVGSALANRSFSFVIWGIQNKSGEMSHLMCNLPVGSYGRLTPDLAVNDASNYSVYTIPKMFQGTGFLIARLTFQLDAGGTQWTLYNNQDLRGYVPNTTAGSGGGGSGVTTWAALSDTPATITAYGIARGNATGTAFDFTTLLKSGATQAAAGAVAGEFWRTSGHATLPDNVILQGV